MRRKIPKKRTYVFSKKVVEKKLKTIKCENLHSNIFTYLICKNYEKLCMFVTSGSRCYKISMKNSKCAISNKHIQDGRPVRYKNRRRTPKNVQTDHPVVPDTRRHTEEAEKRAKPSVVPCRKMSEETLQNQGATCQWIFARTPEPSWRCPRNS